MSKDLDDDEESTNPELAYLAVIRQVRDDNPKLFEAVKRLPKKCKAGKRSTMFREPQTISFIRKGALKTFYRCDTSTPEQMTFMEAIRMIESTPEEKQIRVGSDYYGQLSANETAFDNMVVEDEAVSLERPMVAGNDAKVIHILKAIKSEPRLTDDQEATSELLIRRWENGEMPAKIGKDVVKKANTPMDTLELFYEIMKLVPDTYLEEHKSSKSLVDGEKQVILSCYLISEGNK